jgi:hypothetical protein
VDRENERKETMTMEEVVKFAAAQLVDFLASQGIDCCIPFRVDWSLFESKLGRKIEMNERRRIRRLLQKEIERQFDSISFCNCIECNEDASEYANVGEYLARGKVE